MIFDIMTLFPEVVRAVLDSSITGRAQAAGHIKINTYNIRDYSKDKHRRVDDTPYGGGRGMLMTPQPIYDCYQAILKCARANHAGLFIFRRRKSLHTTNS